MNKHFIQIKSAWLIGMVNYCTNRQQQEPLHHNHWQQRIEYYRQRLISHTQLNTQ